MEAVGEIMGKLCDNGLSFFLFFLTSVVIIKNKVYSFIIETRSKTYYYDILYISIQLRMTVKNKLRPSKLNSDPPNRLKDEFFLFAVSHTETPIGTNAGPTNEYRY